MNPGTFSDTVNGLIAFNEDKAGTLLAIKDAAGTWFNDNIIEGDAEDRAAAIGQLAGILAFAYLTRGVGTAAQAKIKAIKGLKIRGFDGKTRRSGGGRGGRGV
jgi:hypothetical protein